jgi:hypothetical protein
MVEVMEQRTLGTGGRNMKNIKGWIFEPGVTLKAYITG